MPDICAKFKANQIKIKAVQMIIDFAQAQTIDLKNGQGLKITTSGQQACTVTFKEFSAGLTRDTNMSLRLYEGDHIYGRDGAPYAIIDSMNTQSMIDITLPGCRAEIIGKDGCRELLSGALGIEPESLPDTINIFLDVNIPANGMIQMANNTSQACDYIVIRCMRDITLAISACPDSRFGEEGRITLKIL
ncbi:MAG TPA: DUF1989 domain-containing protein [Methanosarcinaceae archaeon]|nr:DUF1989 domain-containing protein [Methanosarcinaceae archaeon]